MFRLQFVIGLFIGFQFNIMYKVLNAPINAENELDETAPLRDPNWKPTFWPDGIIPLEIAPSLPKKEKEDLMSAVQEFTSTTCLQFPMRTAEKDYVYITNELDVCNVWIGKKGGRQNFNLNRKACTFTFSVVHIVRQLYFVLGFQFENNRNDRDDYVKIMWDNIKEYSKSYFEKRTEKIDPKVDLTYDYASLTHFGSYFPENAIVETKPVIIPLYNTTDSLRMGQRVGLSPLDIKKVNVRYGCPTSEEINDLYSISFQFTSGNISLDLKYNTSDEYNNE